MRLDLNDDERRRAQKGQAVEVTAPGTDETYVVIAKPRCDAEVAAADISEGIRLSQEAYRRDLPDLLRQTSLPGQWVAYHRHERIGIAQDGNTLLDECVRRGLPDGEFFLGWIHPYGLETEEEISSRPGHVFGPANEDS